METLKETINFYYDPKVSRFDTNLWKVVSGSAPSVSESGLIVNNSEIISYNELKKATLIADKVRIPTAPIGGDDRFIGFAQLSAGVYLGFKILDDELLCYSCNEKGEESSVSVAWRSVWTDTDISFKIMSSGFDARFFINNEQVAYINAGSTVSYVGYVLSQYPMNVYIRNINTDNMSIGALNALDIYSYVTFLPPTNTNTDLAVSEHEDLSVLEGNSDSGQEYISSSETASITEVVTIATGVEATGLLTEATTTSDVLTDINAHMTNGGIVETATIEESVNAAVED
jgi:hypothetical protein